MEERKVNNNSEKGLVENQNELCKFALDQGADASVVIKKEDIIIDPRVQFKCMIPTCSMAGNCDHCPPYGKTADTIQNVVSGYEWGIFFNIKVKSKFIAARDMAESIKTGVLDNSGILLNLGKRYMQIYSILKHLKEKMVSMGYKSGRIFGAGNCRDVFCFTQPNCQKLGSKKGCRHPSISAPSMESCGMDVFTMAARVGWDIYPIGGRITPEDVPYGLLMGLAITT